MAFSGNEVSSIMPGHSARFDQKKQKTQNWIRGWVGPRHDCNDVHIKQRLPLL
jgi:hypothetical protein